VCGGTRNVASPSQSERAFERATEGGEAHYSLYYYASACNLARHRCTPVSSQSRAHLISPLALKSALKARPFAGAMAMERALVRLLRTQALRAASSPALLQVSSPLSLHAVLVRRSWLNGEVMVAGLCLVAERSGWNRLAVTAAAAGA
jgi:hypothetical protein